MKNIATVYLLLILVTAIKAQDTTKEPTVVFKSNLTFKPDQFYEFYSSFNITGNQVLFMANNYKLYCFNKNTGYMDWEFNTNRKSNVSPFFYDGSIFTGQSIDHKNSCVRVSLKDGSLLQTLAVGSLYSQPLFKDTIMYSTAIDEEFGGIITAYDLKNNTTIWKKNIGHGCNRKPYYLENKIIANIDEYLWVELNYDGTLFDTKCKEKYAMGDEEYCLKEFWYLTHNQKIVDWDAISTHLEEDDGNAIKVKYTLNETIILGGTKIITIGDNNKIMKEINLYETDIPFEQYVNDCKEILRIEVNTIWFFYENWLVAYDVENNKTIKMFDLSKWNPHQVMLDENNIWLISKTDGQLYELKME